MIGLLKFVVSGLVVVAGAAAVAAVKSATTGPSKEALTQEAREKNAAAQRKDS